MGAIADPFRPAEATVRVLIVDDDPAWLAYVRAVLADAGEVQVDSAATYRDARSAMREHHYDLSLIDYQLDEADGLAVLREGTARGTAGAAIIVSGSDVSSLRATAQAQGAVAVMGKTAFDEDVIRLLIRQAAATRARLAPDARLRAGVDAALTESQLKFSTVFASSTSPMFIFEVGTGILVDVNPAFTQLAGLPEQALLGVDARALDLWATDAHYAVIGRMVDGETVRNVDMQLRDGGGGLRHALIAAERITDPEAPRHLAVCIATDVTENRQLDLQFRQAQKMEAVGQLAGGIAHDFNNLLTVINGYGEMLEGRDLPEDVLADVRAILHAGKSAAALTRQLLAFSRRAMLEPRPTDLNQVARHLNSILRRLIGEDIVLDLALADAVPLVMADPGQIDQVIINLAVNARDAMPMGGRLTIETGSMMIDETYVAAHPGSRSGPHAMIAVTDTGVGMDDTVKRRLFEPFFTTKERGRGTGLGLSMVYGTVKQSGGSIWVYSEPGLGTTFKIYLPTTDLRERAEIKRERAPALSGRETILLVEDQDDVRRLARQVLERHGYTVIDVANPRDTFKLDLGPSQHVDLLLTDVVMPLISGRQLARVWQARYPHIRVLYMSGYTADTIVRHGVLEEGLAFIAKPFEAAVLLAKIREVLDGPEPPKT